MKIYVIVEEVGAYSDMRYTLLHAYNTQEEADAYIAEETSRSKALHDDYWFIQESHRNDYAKIEIVYSAATPDDVPWNAPKDIKLARTAVNLAREEKRQLAYDAVYKKRQEEWVAKGHELPMHDPEATLDVHEIELK